LDIKKMTAFGPPDESSTSVVSSLGLKDKKSGVNVYTADWKDINRTAYLPMYGRIFSRWMKDIQTCGRFLKYILGREVVVTSVKCEFEESGSSLNTKTYRYDVLAEDEYFAIYNIESQIRYKPGHRCRAFCYGDRLASNSISMGSEYTDLKPITVIFLNVVNKEGCGIIEDIYLCDVANNHNIYLNEFRIIEFNFDKIIDCFSEIASDKRTVSVDSILSKYRITKDIFFAFIVCVAGHDSKILKSWCNILELDESTLITNMEHSFSTMYKVQDVHELAVNFTFDQVIGEDGKYMSTRVIDTLALQQRELRGEARGEARGEIRGKLDLVLKMFKLRFDVKTVSELSGIDSSFLEKVHSFPDIPLEEAIKLYYSMIVTDKK
jgi:hypothetical protein